MTIAIPSTRAVSLEERFKTAKGILEKVAEIKVPGGTPTEKAHIVGAMDGTAEGMAVNFGYRCSNPIPDDVGMAFLGRFEFAESPEGWVIGRITIHYAMDRAGSDVTTIAFENGATALAYIRKNL